MGMSSRKKLLVYTIIYHVIFLLFVINLNEVFLGHHKPMFASVIMGFIFSMMLSFVLHLVNIKNSLHGLGAAFFVTFNVIFWWKVPGLELSLDHPQQSYFFASATNLIILTAVIWARLSLKAHKNSEMAYGIIIGILSPLLLTLLTYGV
jgi:tetrahydromethanopterin S-methyltransferase subunit F